MSTRGYLLFRRRWCGALTAYYQHHDTYPTSLGKDIIDALIIAADMEGTITIENIVEDLNKRGYNLQKAERSFSKPEQVFLEYQSDIEWIYVIDLNDTPNSTSLQIWKTSNPITDTDFCFKVWSSYVRYFPSSHETPNLMYTLELTANMALNALAAYEEATKKCKQPFPAEDTKILVEGI